MIFVLNLTSHQEEIAVTHFTKSTDPSHLIFSH